jgi:hypothetical protein
VMSGVVPPTVDETPARPASHVGNASVDVLLRTRRNADTISGAAPEVNQRRCCRLARERVPTSRPAFVKTSRALGGPPVRGRKTVTGLTPHRLAISLRVTVCDL